MFLPPLTCRHRNARRRFSHVAFKATRMVSHGKCGRFRCCDSNFRNLLETNKFGAGSVVLSYLVSEPLKPSSLGFEPMTIFRGCGICFSNCILKKIFGQGGIILSCLVAELREATSAEIELRTLFCYVCFLISIKYAFQVWWKFIHILSRSNKFYFVCKVA